MGLLAFAGETLSYGLVAVIGHELAHLLAARAMGREIVGIDWRHLHFDYRYPDAGPDWRDRLIGAAPLLSGAAVVALVALSGAGLSGPQWIALAYYTLSGGVEDLRVTKAYNIPEWWSSVAQRT